MTSYVRRGARIVYENPWLRFEAHDILHPNGTPGEHGLVVTPPASAAVIVDGRDVLLERQQRFGANASVLEVVKGGADDGETALACAQRETREEIGIIADRWDALGIAYEIPSIVAHPVHLFLARDCRWVARELETVESIDLVRLPLDDALAAVVEGRIDDAVSAIALLRARARVA